jgi:hypothetical protein
MNKSNKQKENKPNNLSADQKVIAGVDKYFANVPKITVAGTDYTPATLKAVFQAEIDGESQLDQSRAAVTQEVATMRGVRAKARATRTGLRKCILGTYGATAVQMLQDFGMNPPKAASKTAETTAESVVKGRATRKAREEAVKNAVPNAPPAKAAAEVSATPKA